MLALSRYEGQDVIITTPAGEVIRIRVVAVGPQGNVRLSFDADPSIVIDRAEIAERRRAKAPRRKGD